MVCSHNEWNPGWYADFVGLIKRGVGDLKLQFGDMDMSCKLLCCGAEK
jgi:hypothetical protein